MDIAAMQEEVCAWAHDKGWGPDPVRSFADECALLHSEVSEALEAYRKWGFEDATAEANGSTLAKPEGVGSELADVLVRIMYYSLMRGYTINTELGVTDKMKEKCKTFGAECTVMHKIICLADTHFDEGLHGCVEDDLSMLYAMLLHSCELHGLNLEWEYRRKMDYNYTRPYRHGNKVM